MDDAVKKIVKAAVIRIINGTISDKSIAASVLKHDTKVHFVPHQYRVLGGLLQSLNIKFGNFIEELLALIVEQEPTLTALPTSGGKISYTFPKATSAYINNYMARREAPKSAAAFQEEFENLIAEIIRLEQMPDQERFKSTNDLDAIFQTESGQYIYLEVKYVDDHDTGKFSDINRKVLTTYAGLVNYYGITKPEQMRPILYYFANIRRWNNIYLPSTNVYFAERLFDEFFPSLKYQDVDAYLRELGDDPEIVKIFDDLYRKIRYGSLGKTLPEADPVTSDAADTLGL